jgi:hypothetical protein
LPAAWDVIILLTGLSFFGWLGFIRLNDEEVRRIRSKQKKQIARDNLRTLSNYFFVSFGFFIIAVVADYLLHNPGLLGSFVKVDQADPVLVLTVGLAGFFGLLLLITPMAVVRGIGLRGKGLGDIHPPPSGLVIITSYPVAWNLLFLCLVLSHLNQLLLGGQVILAAAGISFIGTFVVWRYWNVIHQWFLLGMLLQGIGLLAVGIAFALGLPTYYTETVRSLVMYRAFVVVGTSTISTFTITSTVATTTV